MVRLVPDPGTWKRRSETPESNAAPDGLTTPPAPVTPHCRSGHYHQVTVFGARPIADWLMLWKPIALAAEPLTKLKSPPDGLANCGLPETGLESTPPVFIGWPLVL